MDSHYGLFASYFITGLTEQAPPSPEKLEGRAVDLILIGSLSIFIGFIVKSLILAKSQVLSLKEDVSSFFSFRC